MNSYIFACLLVLTSSFVGLGNCDQVAPDFDIEFPEISRFRGVGDCNGMGISEFEFINEGGTDAWDCGYNVFLKLDPFDGFQPIDWQSGELSVDNIFVSNEARFQNTDFTTQVRFQVDQTTMVYYVEVKWNGQVTSPAPDIQIYTNLGSDGDEEWLETSNSNGVPDTGDTWLLSDEMDGSDPIQLNVLASPGGNNMGLQYTDDFDGQWIGKGSLGTFQPGESKSVLLFFRAYSYEDRSNINTAVNLANQMDEKYLVSSHLVDFLSDQLDYVQNWSKSRRRVKTQ